MINLSDAQNLIVYKRALIWSTMKNSIKSGQNLLNCFASYTKPDRANRNRRFTVCIVEGNTNNDNGYDND